MKSLSQRSQYALRALQHLAREQNTGPVLISELAEKQELPKKFLESILLELKNQGLLQSKKGRGGGYALLKPASEITLGQVIRIFDGPLAPIPCVSESAFKACPDCKDLETCATRSVMKEVRDGMVKVLDGTTLEDLVKRGDKLERERKPLVMYFI
jgi:Rrf2 family protein